MKRPRRLSGPATNGLRLLLSSRFDTTDRVDTIPLSNVLEEGFAKLRGGRRMELVVDPTT